MTWVATEGSLSRRSWPPCVATGLARRVSQHKFYVATDVRRCGLVLGCDMIFRVTTEATVGMSRHGFWCRDTKATWWN